MVDITITIRIFKEDSLFIAHTPELDVSSCGETENEAKENLIEAVRLFLEEAAHMGTLDQVLEEAGFKKQAEHIRAPIAVIRKVEISLPFLHA
jgi:predicted RNase H-like HicB family nuclease